MIRPAQLEDAEAISQLIYESIQAVMPRPQDEGADTFLQSITAAEVERMLGDPRFRYFVACEQRTLAGFIAIRDNTHLYHLFVAEAFQRRGFGRKLWERAAADAVDRGNSNGFTVNSTPPAIAFYERFGFTVAGPLMQMNGIDFVPMRLSRCALGGCKTPGQESNLSG